VPYNVRTVRRDVEAVKLKLPRVRLMLDTGPYPTPTTSPGHRFHRGRAGFILGEQALEWL